MVTLKHQLDKTDLEKPSRAVQSTSADIVYYRSLSDIPNAKLVEELMRLGAGSNGWQTPNMESARPIIPFMEGRYKATDALLMRSGVKQVVEFAAGFVPRGMNNPQWNFVHTEQDEDALRQMRDITERIISHQQSMPHFVRFDAVTGEGIDNVMACLREEPVGVTHEGMFRYYPNQSKEKTGRLAKAFLERYGGLYVTPDIWTWKNIWCSL
ncbi:MAG: hypothetical protein ABSE71_03985 [Candidatus Micrarchaeaceae archaeon]|jgi:hypothetical protein